MPNKVHNAASGRLSGLRRKLAHAWPVRPCRFHAEGGLVSFSFDDFPKSAADTGAALLEEAGMRATYYTAAGLAGISNHFGPSFEPTDLTRLASRGHEIGAHTFGHLDMAQNKLIDLKADMHRNDEALKQFGIPNPVRSFSFPFGEMTIAAKSLIAGRFATGRSVREGLNAGPGDLLSLNAVSVYSKRTDMVANVEALLASAKRQNAWLIFYTHDVQESPSDWGTSIADFEQIVRLIRQAGLPVATVGDAASRATHR